MTQASARTPGTPGTRSAVAAHPITSAAIAILVAAAIIGTLWVPFYARITPKVGDFPFFYFYLLIFMPVTSLLLFLATQLQKRLNGKPPDTKPLDTLGGER
jgi:membrane protein implicated in regulation of membrane protease activity